MADYNLGTARGVIEIDYNGRGPTQASKDLRGVGSTAEDSAKRTRRAGTQMASAGAIIAGGLALAVNSAADFEKQLSGIESVSGATGDQMEQIRNKALQLGKDTVFSASESANAIEELVKAGVSVQGVMNGAADATVALAAAGGVSMPEAATIASNAMNQFGLAAKQLPGVADAIAGAANASAIDVSDFGYSLGQVGAVAHLAGVDFNDTATAIALMGNAGIRGSDAGTSLKSMFQRLQPTTAKQAATMKELGIITADGSNKFYDAQGNMKSLADVAQVLQGSLKGMTKQQKQATLNTLFGSDAIRAAAIVSDAGSKGFDKMAKSMGKVTAADVAAKRMDNLKGSIEQLKGSLETLMIQIGTPMLHGMRTMVDAITSVLNVVLGLPEPLLRAVTVFAQVLAAGLLLTGMFLKIRAAIQAGGLATALLTGPLGLILVAIAALVAAFVYFYTTNAKFRKFVQDMGKAIQEGLGKALEWLIPRLQEFGKFLVQVFNDSLPYIKQFAAFLQAAFVAALPTIKKFAAFLQELGDIFTKDVIPVIVDMAGNVLGALIDAFHEIVPQVQAMIPAVEDFVSSFVALAVAIGDKVHPVILLIIAVLAILAKVFVSTILPLLVKLQGIFLETFVKVLGHAITAALGIIRGLLNVISGIFKVITGILTGNWGLAWAGVKQILRGAVTVIKSLLVGLLKTAGAILKGLGKVLLAGIQAIPGLLRGAGGLFLAAGKFLIHQFAEGMKSAAGVIQGIATNVWNFVKGLLNGAIAKINSALEFTIDPPGPGKVTVNPPDIPQLSQGGVLTAPTMAWIAEAGQDEAVIPLKKLWAEVDKVYKAGRVSLSDRESASGGRGRVAVHRSAPNRHTLVQGVLSIDRSGRAFIQGVAVAEGDDSDDYADTLGRMR